MTTYLELRQIAAALERAVQEGRIKESDIPEALDVVARELPMIPLQTEKRK